MTSVRPLDNDIVHYALHPLHGHLRGMMGVFDGSQVHDELDHKDVFLPLVDVLGTSLVHVEGKSEVSAADFLDPRQSRNEYVWDDHGFRKGNPVAVNHDFFLPKSGPFHTGDSAKFFSNHANQKNREPTYVIAGLTSSIPAPRKGFSQINDKLSCGIGGKNQSAHDASFPSGTICAGNLGPSDETNYAIDWFYFDAVSEVVGRDQGFRNGAGVVRFSHGGAPS